MRNKIRKVCTRSNRLAQVIRFEADTIIAHRMSYNTAPEWVERSIAEMAHNAMAYAKELVASDPRYVKQC